MNDYTNLTVDQKKVAAIREKMAAGENEAQEGFQLMVSLVLDTLEKHREGASGAPHGVVQRLKEIYTISGFNEVGTLSKSYFNPTFTLANQIHRGKASVAVNYLWDNFTDTGKGLKGSVTQGALYTPGRLNAAWGKLNSNQDSPFGVDMDGIYADTKAGKRRWHELNIKELKELNRGQDSDPEAMTLIMSIIGDPSNTEKKPGSFAKAVETLRKKNEKVKSDTLRDFCDKVDGLIEDLREETNLLIADARIEQAEAAKLKAEKARLARAEVRGKAPIAEQKQKGGEVISREPAPSK